eukprot:10843568-Lingulodinium_polyedra.AAC.1
MASRPQHRLLLTALGEVVVDVRVAGDCAALQQPARPQSHCVEMYQRDFSRAHGCGSFGCPARGSRLIGGQHCPPLHQVHAQGPLKRPFRPRRRRPPLRAQWVIGVRRLLASARSTWPCGAAREAKTGHAPRRWLRLLGSPGRLADTIAQQHL